MKHDSFERNSALENHPKNPFLVRCDVILLKHALTKVESELQTRIVTGFNLVNINPALGYIRSSILNLKILLQRECIEYEDMASVADMLAQAYKQAPLPEILAVWERALDFIADMPIPYRVVEAETESPIGTIIEKKQPAFDEPLVTAFDNSLVTGDVKYGGDWHRCLEIARYCLKKSLWDGDCKLHICGDIQAMHRHIFFMHEEPFTGKLYRHEYDNDGTLFAYLNINDVPVGGAK